MNVKQHPLMEVIARKLSGIESVPRKAQARMVLAACRAARKWHEAEIERLRARVDGLEAEKKTCRWHVTNEDEYPGVYTTECGHMFSLDEGDRAKNGAVYCQYCGGEIKEDAE
jgi:hypothetical protein